MLILSQLLGFLDMLSDGFIYCQVQSFWRTIICLRNSLTLTGSGFLRGLFMPGEPVLRVSLKSLMTLPNLLLLIFFEDLVFRLLLSFVSQLSSMSVAVPRLSEIPVVLLLSFTPERLAFCLILPLSLYFL